MKEPFKTFKYWTQAEYKIGKEKIPIVSQLVLANFFKKKYTNNKPWIWHVCQIFSLLKCKKGIQPFDHTFILYVYPWLIVIYRVDVRVQEHLLFIFLWCWHQVFKNTICGCGSYVCSVQTIPPGHHRQSCYEIFWSIFL